MKKINIKRNLLACVTFLLLPYGSVYAALEGKLEIVNCEQIKGWAWDSADPAIRVNVEIYDVTGPNTKLLATLTAQDLRSYLINTGKGDGKYGFSYLLPASVRTAIRRTFSVRFQGTTTDIANSPKTTGWACFGKLNDTGIQHCSNATDSVPCRETSYKGQDAYYGRDAKALYGLLAKHGAGNAGFDFTKIANDGSVLPAYAILGSEAKDWACTLDNVTGLMWEIKTDDDGLRDKDNTYSWYEPNETINGSFPGYKDQGDCKGHISCDAKSYAAAVNAKKLCSKNNWRVPKKIELYSIENYGRVPAVLDDAYFPNTVYAGYWTSTPLAGDGKRAWARNHKTGDIQDIKEGGYALRLVRSGQ